jgi:hypothetical protein
MRFSRWIAVMLVGAGVACTGRPPATNAPTAPAPARARRGADSTRALALASPPRYATGREVYQIASTGTVVVVGDSNAHSDTISTASVMRFDSRWTATGLEVTGSVTSGRTPGSTGSLVPFSATVDTATARVRLASDSSQSAVSCPMANGAALANVREFLASVPRSLSPGASWIDTVTTVTCRGGIPVTTTARRHFTVTLEPTAGRPEGAVVLVAHTTSAELRGGTSQHGISIALTGHGEGQASQRYQVLTGQLLGGVSTVDVDLQVGTTGHLVALKQRAETRVTPVER